MLLTTGFATCRWTQRLSSSKTRIKTLLPKGISTFDLLTQRLSSSKTRIKTALGFVGVAGDLPYSETKFQ